MATKRFTDIEKWKDPFFENLPNNFKLIWIYLLDDCDNAGLWKKSIKRLNFHCDSNVTEEELLKVFKERLYPITEDTWFIPKFLSFQYGDDWETKNSKPIQSAKNKLNIQGVSIPLQYPIHIVSKELEYTKDTTKDKDKDKDKSKDKDKDIEKELYKYMDKDKALLQKKDKQFREEMYEYMDNSEYHILKKLEDKLMDVTTFKSAYKEIQEYGGVEKYFNALGYDESQRENWKRHFNQKLQIFN